MEKCKYTRESEIYQYTPDCCTELFNDEIVPTNSVHPEDSEDWSFCPFCGSEIIYINEEQE